MLLYSIHPVIYVSRDLSKYEYEKFNTRLVGESSTIYNLSEDDVSNYLKQGFKLIKIGDQFVLYEKMSFL